MIQTETRLMFSLPVRHLRDMSFMDLFLLQLPLKTQSPFHTPISILPPSTPASTSLNASLNSNEDISAYYGKLEESATVTIAKWRKRYEQEKTHAVGLQKLLNAALAENKDLKEKLSRSEACNFRKERMNPQASMMRRLLVNLQLRVSIISKLESNQA